jgi:NAD+ synthase (glutamine-hydrolysing)
MHGFWRIATVVPEVRLADPEGNVRECAGLLAEAEKRDAAVAVFPELCLTGYSCGDLFHQSRLLESADLALWELLRASRGKKVVAAVGLPLRHNGRLYNCAAVMQNGILLGVVPKSYLPNYREFYEDRWFDRGGGIGGDISAGGQRAPFGDRLVFAGESEFMVGVEVCEDLWQVIPPSSRHALAGATVLLNLSASNELVGKAEYRRSLVVGQSARCLAAYVYASAGAGESTSDLVYGGHALVAENGLLVMENERFRRGGGIFTADVDVQRLASLRLSESSFRADRPDPAYRSISLGELNRIKTLQREVAPHPFVPADPALRDARCREIFQIQSAGLARRLEHTAAKAAVLGISGGLDSTLALLVAGEAMRQLDRKASDILAVTMPGFGTSDRTYRNALALAGALGATLREIDITEACRTHFRDIGHDKDNHDVVFENVQARERTQILMDLANQGGGIVVGTGDLSEIALGWSTYNGDHMSMYAVNCGVPKTLVRYLVGWVAENAKPKLRAVLEDVLATPITPELLPADRKGEVQRTEDILGPYELHDFFLYHLVKYGAPPVKLRFLAERAFQGVHSGKQIDRTLNLFLRRFFQQQFKRNCIPDGPKVGTIALSPRGDWRMPADVNPSTWLNQL